MWSLYCSLTQVEDNQREGPARYRKLHVWEPRPASTGSHRVHVQLGGQQGGNPLGMSNLTVCTCPCEEPSLNCVTSGVFLGPRAVCGWWQRPAEVGGVAVWWGWWEGSGCSSRSPGHAYSSTKETLLEDDSSGKTITLIVGSVDVPCKGPGSDIKKSFQRNVQFTTWILRTLEKLGPGCACF